MDFICQYKIFENYLKLFKYDKFIIIKNFQELN